MSTQHNLSNLCVMVTRPKPQGELLCQQIRAHGGRAIYFPTLDIIPPPDLVTLKTQLAQLDQYDWVIFISPQAVYQSAPYIHAANLPIVAVGAGTAQALRSAAFPVKLYPQEDWSSEGLLNLPEFQALKEKKIAIIKGEGGRELLAETLVQRGSEVTQIIAYQRIVPEGDVSEYLDLLRRKTIDVIVCTSNSGLENLKKLLEAAWQELHTVTVLVVSARMEAFASALGFHHIVVAKNASHEAILDTLFRYISKS